MDHCAIGAKSIGRTSEEYAKRIGRVPSPRMPIVCERFEVIYRGATPERAA
jgi:hypothetical protein